MPDVRAQLIIGLVDETKQAAQSAAQSVSAVGQATKDSSLKFTELNSALQLAKQAYGAVTDAIDSVMTPTVALADQVRRLNLDIGATPQEASKLIYAADAMNISTQTLTTALDASIKKGHAPTIEALAQEADKYNSIQDPIARTKLLVDDFGRSGASLGPLMALGGDGIRALGDEAARTGAIMDKDGVTGLVNYQKATKELDASWLGLKTDIAEAVAGPLTFAIQDIASHVQVMTLATKAWQDGRMSLGDFLGTMLELETKGLTPANDLVDKLTTKVYAHVSAIDLLQQKYGVVNPLVGQYTQHIQDTIQPTSTAAETIAYYTGNVNLQADAQKKAADSAQAFNDSIQSGINKAAMSSSIDKAYATHKAALDQYNTAVSTGTGNLANLQQQEKDTLDQVRKTTGEFILQQLALDMKLSPAMELQMAKALGLVNEKEYNLAQTVLGATKLFDLNKNGLIDNGTEADALAKYLAGLQEQTVKTSDVVPDLTKHIGGLGGSAHGAAQDLWDVKKAEDAIHDKTITITTRFVSKHYEGGAGSDPGGGAGTNSGGGTASSGTGTTGTNPDGSPRAAAGADFIVPPGYPNDSYPLRVQSGEHVKVTPAGGSSDLAELRQIIAGIPRAIRDGLMLARV